MTFTKYIALMLLGFALFVGYQAYAKHERCAGLRQAAEDDNLTVPENGMLFKQNTSKHAARTKTKNIITGGTHGNN